MEKKCVRLKGSENAFICVIFDQNSQPIYVIGDPVNLFGMFPVTFKADDETHMINMIGDLFKIKSPKTLFECIDYNEKNFISKPKMIVRNGLN